MLLRQAGLVLGARLPEGQVYQVELGLALESDELYTL